jgi:hypothetical protein
MCSLVVNWCSVWCWLMDLVFLLLFFLGKVNMYLWARHKTLVVKSYGEVCEKLVWWGGLFCVNLSCSHLLGEITPSYILHTRAFGTYLLGDYLPCKKIIRWWYFTCKMRENIICDVILHVNMFHYFKIPYFTCNFFTKFNYNEYIGPYFFLSHVVLRFLPSDLPESHCIISAVKVAT